ncbi:MAG: hypothetical protein R6X15_07305 [Pseudomonadota bacterium]
MPRSGSEPSPRAQSSGRALDARASADEIRHTLLLLTTTIGFPGVMAAMDWAENIIEKK